VLVVPRSPRGRIVHGHELVKMDAGGGSPFTSCAESRRGGNPGGTKVRRLSGGTPARWQVTGCNQDLRNRSRRLACPCCYSVESPTTSTATGGHHRHNDHAASWRSGIPWSFTAHRWTSLRTTYCEGKAASASFVRLNFWGRFKDRQGLGTGFAEQRPRYSHGRPHSQQGSEGIRAPAVVLCPARLVEVKGHRFCSSLEDPSTQGA